MTDNSSRLKIAQAYKQVFSDTPAGIVVLDDLHRRFDDYNNFDADPYRNAYNQGKREVIRFIQRQLGISMQPPADYGQPVLFDGIELNELE